MPISETLNRWQKAGDEQMFKVIVAPEFAHRLDLKRHVTELVQHMEKDLGTKLQWVAIAHRNTDDDHVHVAIRGVDDRGRKLEISPDYIQAGSRQRAQEASTRQLGFRTQRDMDEAMERQVTQQRFTDIDRALMKKAVDRRVAFEGEPPAGEPARETRIRQIRRLVQLETMGLAEREGPRAWRLKPTLESALRQMQKAQDRLKTKFAHRELISDPHAPLVATELKTIGQRVAGKLVGTGVDEGSGRPYMLVEGFDGKVHYVHQTAAVQRMRGEGVLKAGEFVALEVVSRRDKSGQAVGAMVKVERHGRAMTPELLDRELLQQGRAVEPITSKKTVAGAFLQAASDRLQLLQSRGAVEVAGGRVALKSAEAHDRVRFADAGHHVDDYAGGAVLGRVVDKGRASVAVRDVAGGRPRALTALQLQAMGMDLKYLARDATVFVGTDSKGQGAAWVIKSEQLAGQVQDLRPNRLDLMAQQLRGPIGDKSVASAVQQREAVWKQRGVSLRSADFGKDAAIWRKNMELAESSDLANVVSARQLNRLDWMLQQAYQPTTAPLERALRERAEVWKERGVDPMDPKFSLRANMWRKSIERQEAVQTKGAAMVVDEISRERGKAVRELDCERGRQVSGQVLLVDKRPDQTAVLIDSGRELTMLRQPAPNEADLKAGMRVRARAEEITDANNKRQMMTWRFADLEREQSRTKGQERSKF